MMDQAEASAHVQFVYDVAAGRVVFANAAYDTVLRGDRTRVNEELPGLLARLHPDDRQYLAYYWKLWVRGQMPDEVEIRLLDPTHPDQPAQWFCLTPYYQRTDVGACSWPGPCATSPPPSTTRKTPTHSTRARTRRWKFSPTT